MTGRQRRRKKILMQLHLRLPCAQVKGQVAVPQDQLAVSATYGS